MHDDSFISQTAPLRALGGRRVWSLMVSLFGDLAQRQGQAIEGPVLSAIMTALQVRPEATRVALHRLRKDGWVESTKSGRISRHSLTPQGRAQSAAASPRIYAVPDRASENWQLVLTQDATPGGQTQMADLGFATVMPRVFVGPADAPAPPGAVSLTGTQAPDWLCQQAEPEPLYQGYVDLLNILTTLQTDLNKTTDLAPLDTAVLRCLIVHNWRRLVLKHPALPAPLVRPDWPGHQCHLVVHDLLTRFPRPRLRDLADQRTAA